MIYKVGLKYRVLSCYSFHNLHQNAKWEITFLNQNFAFFIYL